jgi:F-type H+-transporting ATPase subunit delta
MAEIATLARPYANAIFDIAKADGQFDVWSRQLAFAAAAVAAPVLKAFVDAPAATSDEKARRIASVCGDDLSQKGRRLLEVLAHNKRLHLLPEISAQYEVLRAQAEKSLDVEVVSAHALGDEERNRLLGVLKRRFDRDIQLTSRVDANLMGGVVIRAGDTVIDGSVRGKLEKLAETLQRT